MISNGCITARTFGLKRVRSKRHLLFLTRTKLATKLAGIAMHFTVERARLVKMLESVRRKLPGQKMKDKDVRLFACSARVFVEANGVTAGAEALVLRDGGCLQ